MCRRTKGGKYTREPVIEGFCDQSICFIDDLSSAIKAKAKSLVSRER